jgi:hypothetical protein
MFNPDSNTQKQTMNKQSFRYVLAVGLAALPGLIQAQPTAHYVAGIEGIKGASLPPPGIYLRDYNYFFTAGQRNDVAGHKIDGMEFEALTYANIPRVIWITDTKVLGGFVGVDALVPLVSQQANISVGGSPFFNGNTFGVGDLFTEATLSWHPTQFDLALGCGIHMPTGESPKVGDIPSVRAGLGYWTPMLTAGATWYIDRAKTWAVSALNRYEFNTEQRHTHITPGQAYTLEWGVSKTMEKVIDSGLSGHYQQQVTTDRGTGFSNRDRVAAAGPEICGAFPEYMTFVSMRFLYEFMAEDRARGQVVALTLTKRF